MKNLKILANKYTSRKFNAKESPHNWTFKELNTVSTQKSQHLTNKSSKKVKINKFRLSLKNSNCKNKRIINYPPKTKRNKNSLKNSPLSTKTTSTKKSKSEEKKKKNNND